MAALSEEKSPEKPDPATSARSKKSLYPPSRVTGWGPQAQATLVDELLECDQKAVAAKVGKCGGRPLPKAEFVEVMSRGKGKRHMAGLCHCGRFQVCPCCTPYLMAKRLEALAPLAAQLAADPNLRFFMCVLTIRHRFGAKWKPLVDALRDMVTAIREGHIWREAGAGYIRLLETTFRENGHHPHVHLLMALRVPAGWDPAPFFRWVQELCERQAQKADRTCAFQGDWWSEIDRPNLVKAINYFGAEDKMGTHPGSALLELNSASKHMPTWCIPAKAFAEVYLVSTGLRWYNVAGCWKTKKTAKSDEELEKERVSTGQGIAHILARIYRTWTPRERRDRRAVIYDAVLTDGQVVEYVVACGGVAGPAPKADPVPD